MPPSKNIYLILLRKKVSELTVEGLIKLDKLLLKLRCFHVRTVLRCFEEGKQAGIFRQELPSRHIAEFVLAQIQGAFLLRKTHKEPEVLENNFEVLRGVLKQWST